MHCSWIQPRLSSYADGELSGWSGLAVRLHLQVCASCWEDAELLDGARSPLRLLAVPEPPLSLGTQLRAAISVELARGNPWQRKMKQWKIAFREGMKPMAVRTLGGALSTILLFSIVIPDLWSTRVEASDDVPLTYLTSGLASNPELQREAMLSPFSEDTTVLVFIDTRGAMYDFQLPEEQRQNTKLRAEIAQSLLLAEFEPATFFGQPVLGRVVITFTTVKG